MLWSLLALPALLPTAQADLRLLPTPAQVSLAAGSCPAAALRVVLAEPADADNRFAAELLRETMGECGIKETADGLPVQLVTAASGTANDESYELRVAADRIDLTGHSAAGTFYAVQTLRQLLRANRDAEGRLPCLTIADRPAFPHRGFSDDITRGPFPTVAELKREIVLASELKLNFVTYYIEHVFQVPSHPDICPAGAGLSKAVLAELEPFARRYHVELIGCFQSFGHMWNVLKHEPYKRLAENPDVISPALEDSYKLLGDIYAAVAPSFSSTYFNVCCDEVGGLGAGPAKALVAKLGVGGVYAGHIKRLHELLKPYGKRMMMWGDIVLQHPEQLADLPKDIIMLSWGYHPGASFDAAIVPFKQSGFEFWVCPGVSCWSQMIPNHTVALVNIHNYLRDGARLGASGVLNTTWDDDGENLFECNWYALAWGAQCSWRPTDSDPAQFDRAWGPCFYGSPGDSAAAAMQAMSPALQMAAFEGLNDRAFWADPFGQPAESPARADGAARALLACCDESLKQLDAALAAAQRNQIALLAYQFEVRRVRAMALNRLARLDAGRQYTKAANGAPAAAGPGIAAAKEALQASRDRIAALREQYRERWLAECEPYWLDQILKRWDGLLGRYDAVLKRLDSASAAAAKGQAVPLAEELGLALLADLSRLTPVRRGSVTAPALWPVAGAVARLPLELAAANPARAFYPADVALPPAAGLLDDPARFTVTVVRSSDGGVVGPGQLWRASDGSLRLAFRGPQAAPAGAKLALSAYLVPTATAPTACASPAKELPGGVWLENEQVRLLLGPEGGHIYRWLVKALGNVDLCDAGDNSYHGFLDEGGEGRGARYKLEVVTQGPVLARVRATCGNDREKVVTLYAGEPVVEVLTSPGYGYFWCFDRVANMAGDTATPGTILFSTGQTAPVPKGGAQEQVRAHALWSAKHRADGLTLALLTPGGANRHVAGPGGGWGGVGLEGARPENHFVVVGGVLGQDRRAVLDGWVVATSRNGQPVATVGAWEPAPTAR